MLEFAAPLGLAALGALVVPLLIHLVRRPRQVVRLGSLRFLREDRFRISSVRWRQWLLLALRGGAIAALALLIAAPRWHGQSTAVRWRLLSPLATLDSATRGEWDRLQAEGFEARWLAPGFPRQENTTASNIGGHERERVEIPSTRSRSWLLEEMDTWSLLREADARVRAGSRAIVFGPTSAADFRGERPVLSRLEVSWRATAGQPAVTVPAPAVVHVAILAADDRQEDAAYLRAAFQAIGGIAIEEPAADWIFQLGAVPLPPALVERVQRGAHLVTDPADSDVRSNVARRFDGGGASVHVRQRATLDRGAAVLLDSLGEPLLTEEKQGRGWRWRFALRFHPDWSDWPLGSAFPAWWRAQIFPAPGLTQSIAPEQAAPAYQPATQPRLPPLRGVDPIDLRAACWILALLCFAVERTLSLTSMQRRTA